MTYQSVIQVDAGHELDALIAEKVMGYIWIAWEFSGAFTYLIEPDDKALGETSIARRRDGVLEPGQYRGPHYSTNIAAAWLVVENMAARRGWKIDVQNRFAPTWACHVHFAAPNYERVFECAESAPLAICKAALAALHVVSRYDSTIAQAKS